MESREALALSKIIHISKSYFSSHLKRIRYKGMIYNFVRGARLLIDKTLNFCLSSNLSSRALSFPESSSAFSITKPIPASVKICASETSDAEVQKHRQSIDRGFQNIVKVARKPPPISA